MSCHVMSWHGMSHADGCIYYALYSLTHAACMYAYIGRVHHVVYEDLVLDTEREARRVVCDVLGLPWEAGVLEAHR